MTELVPPDHEACAAVLFALELPSEPACDRAAAVLDGPILDAQIRKRFKILIGCQNSELMLSSKGRQQHVYLRQDTALAAQLDVDRAVELGGFGIHGPQSNVAQQLG